MGQFNSSQDLCNDSEGNHYQACAPLRSGGLFSGRDIRFSARGSSHERAIKLRLEAFPEGFLVAEINGRVVAILNSAATDKDDISDEELKQLIGHDPDGKNMVIFALAVLPEFQKRGIARQLMARFVEEAREHKKENVLLLCKQNLIAYYQRLGFDHVGLSRSTHGGAEWHEMRLRLGSDSVEP